MSEIPPPPSYANYPRMSPYGDAPRVRFDVIGESFQYLKRKPAVWAVSSLPFLIISLAIFALALFSGASGINGGVPSPETFAIQAMIEIVVGVVYYILMAGLIQMGVDQIRGKEIKVRDAFRFNGSFGQVVGATLLGAVVCMVGTMLCVVPGLILFTVLVATYPLITDRKMGAIDAMRTSAKALWPHFAITLGITILAGLISGVSFYLCGVGLLFGIPFYALTLAGIYADVFVRPHEVDVPTAYAPAPMR